MKENNLTVEDSLDEMGEVVEEVEEVFPMMTVVIQCGGNTVQVSVPSNKNFYPHFSVIEGVKIFTGIHVY